MERKWVCLSLALALTADLSALPEGARIVHGDAKLDFFGNGLKIQQESERLVIDWSGFSIGKGEKVSFLQPSVLSAVLNRVVSESPSELLGHLESNGQVYLINPWGILVGPEGVVDTGGFLASTLQVSDEEFLRGGDLCFSGDAKGSLLQLGKIGAAAGDVFLIGAWVRNEGEIEARQGTAGLAAGREVVLRAEGEERIYISGAIPDARIENSGIIAAAAAEIQASAGNPYALAVSHSGAIQANRFEKVGGRVLLRAGAGEIAIQGKISSQDGSDGGAIDVRGRTIRAGETALLIADAQEEGRGGTIALIGEERTEVRGASYARGGRIAGDGGFIEYSAGTIRFEGPVDATARGKGAHGTLLLDPYDVQLSMVDPGGMISWVDTSPAMPFIMTLDSGMNLTIDTAACTNCTMARSMALLGDITIVDPITVSGSGTLTLNADQDILVNAVVQNSSTGGFDLNAARDVIVSATGSLNTNDQDINITAGQNVQIDYLVQTDMGGDITVTATAGNITINHSFISTGFNVSGTGGITLNAPGGAIDFGTVGVCEVRNPNSLLSISALNQISANTGALNTATWEFLTNGSPATITSTNGPVVMLGGSASLSDTVSGAVSIQTTMGGDITWVGKINCGSLTFDAAGDLWIGNDATGTLAIDGVNSLFNDATALNPITFRGNNVTIRAGEGMNQSINSTSFGDMEVTARTGNFIIRGGSNASGDVDLRSSSSSVVTQAFSAVNGFGLFLAGTGDTNYVQAGTGGIGGNPPGILNITTLGDLTLQAGTGMSSFVDMRTGRGTWTIGGNLRVLGSTNTSSQAVCYQDGTNGQATLDVGLVIDVIGGAGDNATADFVWSDVDFNTGTAPGMNNGTITVQGGGGNAAFARLTLQCSTAAARTVDGDILVLGGMGDNSNAEVFLSSGGGSLAVGRDLTILGGLGEDAYANLLSGAQTIDVANNLLIQGQTAFAGMDFSGDPGNFLLVHNQADLLGGAGGVNPDSTGAALISGDTDLQIEVINNLTMTGGTGAEAGASIQILGLFSACPEVIYVGGDISMTANMTSNGFVGISQLQLMSTGIQRIEAGGNITLSGGIGTSKTAIIGTAVIDPMGLLFMMPIDQPGPNSFVSALGSITCINGTSSNPTGLQNFNDVVFPIPVPPGVGVSTGSVSVQAGRDITLSSLISAGTTLGTMNLNQSIYMEADTQFAMGALWPGSLIMPVSPAAMFPTGALMGNAAPLMTTIDLTTIQNNISLLSAQNNAAAAATDFTTGSAANNFRLFTTNGNILVEGFNDIAIGQALTTTGNGTLVAPATDQIFIRAFQNVSVDNSISLTGSGNSLRIVADKNTMGSFNISLNGDVDVNTLNGIARFLAQTGFIHQTTGTVSGYDLQFSGDLGIINTLLADAAVRTSGTLITGVNTTTGDLNIYNTLAGANTTAATVNLTNGTGALSAGRNVYYEQHGGTSANLSGALADGNISALLYDGLANLNFTGAAIAGDNLIGMAYQNMTVDVLGSVAAELNVTLICDEYAGAADGGSRFTNSSAIGISSNLMPPNIAIYAASGLQPPPGLAVEDLTDLGNLIAIQTWDAALPGGLASKYATSWDAGGAYHGAGFGAVYVPGTGVFGSPVVWYKAIPAVPPLPPQVLSLQSELLQAMSLLADLSRWGEEKAFSIWSETDLIIPQPDFYYAQDPRNPTRIADIYQRCVRRKFLNVP